MADTSDPIDKCYFLIEDEHGDTVHVEPLEVMKAVKQFTVYESFVDLEYLEQEEFQFVSREESEGQSFKALQRCVYGGCAIAGSKAPGLACNSAFITMMIETQLLCMMKEGDVLHRLKGPLPPPRSGHVLLSTGVLGMTCVIGLYRTEEEAYTRISKECQVSEIYDELDELNCEVDQCDITPEFVKNEIETCSGRLMFDVEEFAKGEHLDFSQWSGWVFPQDDFHGRLDRMEYYENTLNLHELSDSYPYRMGGRPVVLL